MTTRSMTFILAACALVSVAQAGCAMTPVVQDSAVTAAGVPSVDIERGLALAERECSRCHAVGATGDSPAPMAPTFRRLAADVGGPALENRLRITSEVGHYEMRPAGLGPADIRDLAAYIDSLD